MLNDSPIDNFYICSFFSWFSETEQKDIAEFQDEVTSCVLYSLSYDIHTPLLSEKKKIWWSQILNRNQWEFLCHICRPSFKIFLQGLNWSYSNPLSFSSCSLVLIMDISCTVKLQVAEIIKEDLWPNPLKYFSNVRFLIMCVLSSLKTSKISPFI